MSEIANMLGAFNDATKPLYERIAELESKLDAVTSTAVQYEQENERLERRLGEIKKALAEALDDYEKTGYVAAVRHVMETIEAPVVERGSSIEPATPPDSTNVTGITDYYSYGIDQLDGPGGPRPNEKCGAMFPPGQFSVQICTLPKGHVGEHENNVKGL